MSSRLYIDDERDPKTDHDWKVVRTSKDAIEYLTRYGCPMYISFDHDLGGDDTSMEVVKWLINMDIDMGTEFIPEGFEFNVHSANPVGAKNIEGYLNSYLSQRFDENDN